MRHLSCAFTAVIKVHAYVTCLLQILMLLTLICVILWSFIFVWKASYCIYTIICIRILCWIADFGCFTEFVVYVICCINCETRSMYCNLMHNLLWNGRDIKTEEQETDEKTSVTAYVTVCFLLANSVIATTHSCSLKKHLILLTCIVATVSTCF